MTETIDSQSVKGADTVGRDTHGYDAGKKVNGRKRFIDTDTLGLLVVVAVMAASWQDRDGARSTLLATYMATPIRHVFRRPGLRRQANRLGFHGPAHHHRDRAEFPPLYGAVVVAEKTVQVDQTTDHRRHTVAGTHRCAMA
ncbi:transposase [Micromonospora sp. 4G55]|uniref:transposase n=1 Tax=Micromonospora sp. 4G55 TaxID=2806102 RepID=UPI001A44EA7A|nr:hypothetical protein [Micromonospora sp. 4G55]